MDGVFVCWVKGCLKVHGSALTPADITGWVNVQLGCSMAEMWAPIDALGPEWWANLEPWPWFEQLWAELQRISEKVYICTSPSHSVHAVPGKKMWLAKYLPDFDQRDIVFTSRKFLLAKPGRVLIDDLPTNVDAFRKEGGQAVLFPQHWNNAEVPEGVGLVEHVVDEVMRLPQEAASMHGPLSCLMPNNDGVPELQFKAVVVDEKLRYLCRACNEIVKLSPPA